MADSFRSMAAVPGRKSVSARDGGPGAFIKPGMRVRLPVELEPKGAAYFRGTLPEFGQFGKVGGARSLIFSLRRPSPSPLPSQDGKVTGSVQRAVAKITMAIQIVAGRVTTSFNFNGHVRRRVAVAAARGGVGLDTSSSSPPTGRWTRQASSQAPSRAARSPSPPAARRAPSFSKCVYVGGECRLKVRAYVGIARGGTSAYA